MAIHTTCCGQHEKLPFLQQCSSGNKGKPLKTGCHKDLSSSRLNMGILMPSEPFHQETKMGIVQLNRTQMHVVYIIKKQ